MSRRVEPEFISRAGAAELADVLGDNDVGPGEHLPADVIPYTRAASLAWLPDDSGFYVPFYAVAAGNSCFKGCRRTI